MAIRPLEIARAIEKGLGDVDGVASLDTRSSLVTRKGREWVRGVEVRPGLGPPKRVAVAIEVIASPTRPLPDAAEDVRGMVKKKCRSAKVKSEHVDVRFTDLEDVNAAPDEEDG